MKGLLIAVLALLAVAGGWYMWQTAPEGANRERQEQVVAEATLTLSNEKVVQGEVLIVEARGPVEYIRLDEEDIALAELNGRMVAVIGFDTRAEVGPRTLHYGTPNGAKTSEFEVVDKAYPTTRIVVPEKLAKEGVTSGDLAKSIAASDNVTLADIVDTETEKYHITDAFVGPTAEWIDVGGFGNVRQDKYGSIRHLGVDLDGETGDPVQATNHGVVVYANNLQNYGNAVVIDHGVGIFSIYLHLSRIETTAGAQVSAGEAIGRIGNTGAYTLEPHLHFSIKVRGVSVNPRAFIDTFNKML